MLSGTITRHNVISTFRKYEIKMPNSSLLNLWDKPPPAGGGGAVDIQKDRVIYFL